MLTSANHHNKEVIMVRLHVPASHLSWLRPVLGRERESYPTFT
jgi:hypothetical protein